MKQIADQARMEEVISDLAKRVLAGTVEREKLAFIGIRRRGDILAQRLAAKLGVSDVGSIDITLYRDDLSEIGSVARVGKTDVPFDVEGRELVLCDDVIMTGRSVLAAIREILDFGRPRRLQLCVLVERPERELPIQPEYSGLVVKPSAGEKVDVRLQEQDDAEGVWIVAARDNVRG